MPDTGQPLINRANSVRESAQASIRAIETNRELTSEAKSARIAAIRAETVTELATLQNEYRSTVTTEIDRLRRRLMTPAGGGTGVDRVAVDASYRDALERARSVDTVSNPNALEQMHADARAVGDSLQAQAALAVALDRNDVDVINAYVADHPITGPDVESLYRLTQEVNDFGIAANFAPIV